MKPRAKNDSWFYPASRSAARRKIKRLANKRHRQADRDVTKRDREEGEDAC